MLQGELKEVMQISDLLIWNEATVELEIETLE